MDVASSHGLYCDSTPEPNGRAMRSTDWTPAGRSTTNSWMLALLLLAMAAGCADRERSALDRAQRDLGPLALDDAFFAAFDALQARAQTDPEAGRLAARFGVRALGRAQALQHPSLTRLLEVQGRDPAAAGRFLARLASQVPEDAPEAPGLMALSAMYREAAANLEPALALAQEQGPVAHGVRLLVAHRLGDVLQSAAAAPENDRGRRVIERLPGFPVPYSRDVTDAAFPRALKTLSLLLTTPGDDPELAEAFAALAADTNPWLDGRVFALPVTLGIGPPVAAPWGVRIGVAPLLVLTLDDDGLHAGTRPVVQWTQGQVSLALPETLFPGPVLVPPDRLDAPLDADDSTAIDAIRRLAAAVAPVERQLDPEGTSQSPRALVLVASGIPASRLRVVLRLAVEAGVSDIRVAIPGLPGAYLPALAFHDAPGDTPPVPAAPRARIAVGPDGCRLVPATRLNAAGLEAALPEGVTLTAKGGRLVHLSIPWNAGVGFAGRVAQTLGLLNREAGIPRLVDVTPDRDDTPARVLIDAAFEVAGFPGDRFPDLESRFPGTRCPAVGPCIGGVPVLFGLEPVRKTK